MRKLTGVVVLIAGVVLLVWGSDASDSINSRISRLFTGAPTDRAMWLLLGGAAAVIVGLGVLLAPRRLPRE